MPQATAAAAPSLPGMSAQATTPTAIPNPIKAPDPLSTEPQSQLRGMFSEHGSGALDSSADPFAEAFPDMSQFRREGASEPQAAPTPIVPLSVAALPDPESYVRPEPAATTKAAPPSSSQPFINPAAEAPPAPPKEEKPLKRSSSKMLDAGYDEPEDEPYNSRGSGAYREPASFTAQAKPSSPLPKMLGGIGILMALCKVPLLMMWLPAISNPQNFGQVADILGTFLALLALGVGLILS